MLDFKLPTNTGTDFNNVTVNIYFMKRNYDILICKSMVKSILKIDD